MTAAPAFLSALADDARAAIDKLLAQAYERGFREGMSAAGAPAAPAQPPPTLPPAVPGEPLAAVDWTDSGAGDTDAGIGEPDDDDLGDPAEPSEPEPPRPISANATVGTLMGRIEETFSLERFDIGLVVFRRGDRDKRQLKVNVRLKKYLK